MSSSSALPPPFVLASASPQRRELLETLGVRQPHILPTHIDETPHPKELASAYVARLAQEKAQAALPLLALQNIHQPFVLGADTTVAVGRRILQKAAHMDEARAQMTLLSGRRHRVYTGVCLITPEGKVRVRVACCRVAVKRLSALELETFLQRREWEGVCVYRLTLTAGAFISWMSGTPSTIIGLPLYETAQLLQGNGYPLWTASSPAAPSVL
jgi:septum formation protein